VVVYDGNFHNFTGAEAIWHRIAFHFAMAGRVRCNLSIDPAFPSDMNSAQLCGGAGPLRLRIFAWFMARCGMKTDQYLGHYKSRLFSKLSGIVLEIGSGAGANLHYFPRTAIKWIGVDPNPFMKSHLVKEAHRLGLEIELRDGTAEMLPAEDESVDFVISTRCSVA